jgi:hypothetical protein
LSAKPATDALSRIIAAVPEALLTAELARRIGEASRQDQAAPPKAPDPAPPRAPQSRTINQWCADRRVSRSTLYLMWREGRGPKFYRAGRAIRISEEADAAWLAESEAAA